MTNAAKKRLRKDLLLIGALAVGLVSSFIVLSVVDGDGATVSGWSQSFYDFLLSR